MCGPIGSIHHLRIGNTSFAPLRGKMVRANKSRFDAGDAAMLTFLLDKQDSLQRRQTGPSGRDAEPPVSLQADRQSSADRHSLHTAMAAQSTQRVLSWQTLASSLYSRVATSAQLLLASLKCDGRCSKNANSLIRKMFGRCDLHIVSEVAQPGHLWLTSNAGVTRSR